MDSQLLDEIRLQRGVWVCVHVMMKTESAALEQKLGVVGVRVVM